MKNKNLKVNNRDNKINERNRKLVHNLVTHKMMNCTVMYNNLLLLHSASLVHDFSVDRQKRNYHPSYSNC